MAKRIFRRPFKRKCRFCEEQVKHIDYKDVLRIAQYITDRGKIRSRRTTGNCARHQRMLARAIKRARIVALLPFTREQYR
ncbi:MAG: 30S ribosomal protein S18 [Candidatus Coatesbacteria bacterium 4484_99]|uniref:Small ribosomal subunit protein bS18 n=1 Tax=Candidatus Coatesbacteria bacterium 4484_99 TaxID=1970774 RepID=A0A1W9S245_9BACT|nr:MAG: 30S ribosomal protein S18 [Candidatus Coatesbacteria bacterium 4484_99]RLC40680.1 MAG: 30S ribosomal protein S18 [Candidatus Coatesbacteria bacterium]RLC41242.1 MAG: 30S ribosomal protein S18 [Candidatus Coatesbacteria bacterium]RLC42663.1 MAG: 30S ribosomal protein S18 [Candidatus Coatesbacteria bacterium]